MSKENARYKYCIVPMCKNTSASTPEKIFVCVPKNPHDRKKWCMAMKRDNKKSPLSSTCNRYCCEDHFNLTEDLIDFPKSVSPGGILKLKKNIVPHIFRCQNLSSGDADSSESGNLTYFLNMDENKGTSASTSRGGNTDDEHIGDSFVPSSSNEVEISNAQTSSNESDSDNTTDKNNVVNIKSDTEHSLDETVLPVNTDELEKRSQAELRRIETFMNINRDPEYYIGIIKSKYYVVQILSRKLRIPLIHILMTLRKIKLNEPFETIERVFSINKGNVCDIFNQTVPVLADYLKDLVIKPESNKTKDTLSKTQSILNCLELQIEMPTANYIDKNLTWSEYRGCDTVKYLMSLSLNGVINYVSCGFAGGASDADLIEDCGFMEHLSPGMWVMSDKSFENDYIADRLLRQGCRIVETSNFRCESGDIEPLKKKRVVYPSDSLLDPLKLKQIEDLKCNVELVIANLRKFGMLLTSSCIDKSHVAIIDQIVIIVCALINLHDKSINIV